jgi:hypothetical protein
MAYCYILSVYLLVFISLKNEALLQSLGAFSSLFTLKHEPLLQSLSVFSGLYTLKKGTTTAISVCLAALIHTLKHELLPLPLIVFKRLLYSFSICIHFSDYGWGGGRGRDSSPVERSAF